LKTEDEVESVPRKPGTDKARKKKSTTHIHIGPYAKAYRYGLAQCPVCDAERICGPGERKERFVEKAVVPSPREAAKSYTRTKR
jgi:hypothetical protein